MQFFRYERDPRDIQAVQQFADSILSVAEEQALSNAKQIIEHDEMQDDKEVIIRARDGLVDAQAEIKRTQKEIERAPAPAPQTVSRPPRVHLVRVLVHDRVVY
ncbi:hypothetical protein CspHIS471_0103770 [Cutaneotrichosporon sp. HIS471]|nr:hypothetical protein CspHIS471_0103770 [Cutaneotrichosporon sp. HIS471]